MNAARHPLARTNALIIALVATLAIGAAFMPVQQAIGGELLDMMMTGEAARERLAALTPGQRQIHLWATLGLDTAYPLAYGSLLAGLALRFSRGLMRWVAWPAVLVVLFDLTENGVQALALIGVADFLGVKTVLTPAKFTMFAVAALLALVLMLRAGWLRRFRGPPP